MNGQEEKPGVSPGKSSAPPVFHPPPPVWLAASPRHSLHAGSRRDSCTAALGAPQGPAMGNAISTRALNTRPGWDLQSRAGAQTGAAPPQRGQPPGRRHRAAPSPTKCSPAKLGPAQPSSAKRGPALPAPPPRVGAHGWLPWQTQRELLLQVHTSAEPILIENINTTLCIAPL